MDEILAITFLRDGDLWGLWDFRQSCTLMKEKSIGQKRGNQRRLEDIFPVCMWTHGTLTIIRYVYYPDGGNLGYYFSKGWMLVKKQSSGNHAFNPHWHELWSQEKYSLASPRGLFYKTQWAWQGVKLTRLMSIFTSKKVWKFLIKNQLTKSDPKRIRR